jgi:hypothetical protein
MRSYYKNGLAKHDVRDHDVLRFETASNDVMKEVMSAASFQRGKIWDAHCISRLSAARASLNWTSRVCEFSK